MIADVALHWGLELLGGAGLACTLRLCAHPECRGRLPWLRALVASRVARAAAYGAATLAMSVITVLLLG